MAPRPPGGEDLLLTWPVAARYDPPYELAQIKSWLDELPAAWLDEWPLTRPNRLPRCKGWIGCQRQARACFLSTERSYDGNSCDPTTHIP